MSSVSAVQRQQDDEPANPCVRQCCLDASDTCCGCRRTLQEILDWHRMSPEQKRSLLEELKTRAPAGNTRQDR